MFKYRGIVVEVIDELNVRIAVDLGFNTVKYESFKLAAIDTSEVRRSKETTDKVRAFISESLLNKEVTIKTLKPESGKYIVFIYIDGHQKSFNDELIENGSVKSYEKGLKSKNDYLS